MATYVNDLRLKEIATGDESGTWGVSTNTNLELIAEGFSYATVDPFDTDADKTETMADGATDPIRSLYLKVTSTSTLTATRTLTLAPNTVSKVWIIENATTGSQSITISQGSGSTVTIPNGDVKVIYTDGAGAGAAVTDAFANLKVTDAAQTNITSVGTLTGLTVSGDATFDTNTLYVDSTNNRVGIGTASPGNPLVVRTGTNENFAIQTKSGAIGITAYNDAVTSNIDLHLQATQIIFDNGATEAMRITSGLVGIGTAAPADELDISSTSPAIRLTDTTTAGLYHNIVSASDDLVLSADAGNVGANTEIEFHIDGSEKMRITSSGNVGIGTSGPARSPLHLATNGTDYCQVHMTNGTSGSTSSDGLTLFTNGTDAGLMQRENSYLLFGTNDTERMRIDSSGNLLVGTSTAVETLTVDGNVDADDYIGNTSLSNRNALINGGMDYNQRYGYSTTYTLTGIIADYFADRWLIFQGQGAGVCSMSTDVPDARFKYSFKYDITTSASASFLGYRQRVEGYNVQRFAAAGSGAKKVSISFWIKSNKTGDIQVTINRSNANRHIGNTVTINSANTWEYKSLTFPGDTGGASDDRGNGQGWEVDIWLDAGGAYTGGSVPTTWQAEADNQRGAGVTLGLCDSTSNEVLLTGVQLEAGEPTPFEFIPLSDTQARCHRYFYSSYSTGQPVQQNNQGGEDWHLMAFRHKFADVTGLRSEYMQWQPGGRMRTVPTRTIYTATATGNTGTFYLYSATGATQNTGLNSAASETHGYWWKYTGMSVGQTGDSVQILGHYTADAEL